MSSITINGVLIEPRNLTSLAQFEAVPEGGRVNIGSAGFRRTKRGYVRTATAAGTPHEYTTDYLVTLAADRGTPGVLLDARSHLPVRVGDVVEVTSAYGVVTGFNKPIVAIVTSTTEDKQFWDGGVHRYKVYSLSESGKSVAPARTWWAEKVVRATDEQIRKHQAYDATKYGKPVKRQAVVGDVIVPTMNLPWTSPPVVQGVPLIVESVNDHRMNVTVNVRQMDRKGKAVSDQPSVVMYDSEYEVLPPLQTERREGDVIHDGETIASLPEYTVIEPLHYTERLTFTKVGEKWLAPGMDLDFAATLTSMPDYWMKSGIKVLSLRKSA